jgi:diguanylate cyclase (GGDEF)-like protein
MQDTIRKADSLGRYGGEEFLVILPQTPAPGAQTAAENLLREIRALRIQTENAVLNITASVGLATISSADATFDTILGRADTALYEAKRAGKDRAVTAEANR